MSYLLDTSSFSALVRGDSRSRSRLTALGPTERIVICTITRGEVLYGISRLPRGRRRTHLTERAVRLFRRFPCVPLVEGIGDQYARLKRDTERLGTPLDENDLWIAAAALYHDAVLVATDSDFRKISDLQVEDWTVASPEQAP